MTQIASSLTISNALQLKELFPGPITPGAETGNPASIPGVDRSAQTTVYSSNSIFRGWAGSLPVVERPNGTWDVLYPNSSIL